MSTMADQRVNQGQPPSPSVPLPQGEGSSPLSDASLPQVEVFVDRRRGASKISWRESASSLGTILPLGVEQLFSAGGLIRR